MFDGLILMSGGQLINDTNFQILLMGNVFSCLFIVQLSWYPECLITSQVRLVMWDTWSIMVDLRHGSRTAAKRLGEGGPSPGSGPAPWPSRKACRLRRGGGVLAWELRKSYGGGQINHFLRLKITLMAFAMPSFQFLVKSGKSMLMAVMWRIRYDPICFHFSNSEHISATNQENHYVPPLTVFTDSKPYLFAVYHTSPGGPGRWPQNSPAGRKPFAKTFNWFQCNQK